MRTERPSNVRPDGPWHALEAQVVLQRLGTSRAGLAGREARERLARHGPNCLPGPARQSAFRRLLAQFDNVLIYVLLGAGTVTALLAHWADTSVILGVVVINALIGFLQEGKAERALEAVGRLLSAQAAAIRDGRRVSLAAEDLVPGDLVWLQSGDRVPADLRLIEVRELLVDEAMLTGESVPLAKSTGALPRQTILPERTCIAYSGTLVTAGRGTGVVVATGQATEIGRISGMLGSVQTLSTPLLRQLGRFGRWLTGAILAVAAATFAFGVLVRGYGPGEMFLAAVGLAVAAIPEGLPAVITIALALGVQQMARRNAIIRRLPAVEALGSVTVICSDKTGTLTRNEMTVRSVLSAEHRFQVGGVGYEARGDFSLGDLDGLAPVDFPDLMEICRAALLCNDAVGHAASDGWHFQGEPTEMALAVLGVKAGLDLTRLVEELPRDDVIPFESGHRFMATLHHDHASHRFIYLKGAPEAVLERCSRQRVAGTDRVIDPTLWTQLIDDLGAQGQRSLALAIAPMPGESRSLAFGDVEGGLTLLGLVGMIDPPRREAIEAVAGCRAAGITVKMITGDHARTAQAVAAAIGLSADRPVLTGIEIEQASDETLAAAAQQTEVFARVSPEHKLRLVHALQTRGEVVAMTGDGVNDAPALKRADVGVAMGVKGTEVAKESAEMVLADDNFASIASAVEEGRRVYDNICKSILFILPTNVGEALTILAAVALGRMLPVTAAQILWVNMVTAVTLALALAFEPVEPGAMRRAPRPPDQPILTGFMLWRVLFVSLIMVGATFGLFLWDRAQGAEIEVARTVAVNTLVVLEAFYLLSTRSLLGPAIRRGGLSGNPKIMLSILVVLGIQLAFTYAGPMNRFFHSVALPAEIWLRILAAGSTVLILVEIEKAILRRWRSDPRL